MPYNIEAIDNLDGVCWTTERGGWGNQLLPCLNNYTYFNLFAETLNDIHNSEGK
jgi:hypothetical protein